MCVCVGVRFCVRVYLLLLVLVSIEESRPNTNDEQAHQQAAVRDESTIPAHRRSHVTVCLQKLHHSLRSIVCLHLSGSTRSLTAIRRMLLSRRVSPPDPRPEGRESRHFFDFLGRESGVDSRGKKGRKGSEGRELGSGVRLQCKTSPT